MKSTFSNYVPIHLWNFFVSLEEQFRYKFDGSMISSSNTGWLPKVPLQGLVNAFDRGLNKLLSGREHESHQNPPPSQGPTSLGYGSSYSNELPPMTHTPSTYDSSFVTSFPSISTSKVIVSQQEEFSPTPMISSIQPMVPSSHYPMTQPMIPSPLEFELSHSSTLNSDQMISPNSLPSTQVISHEVPQKTIIEETTPSIQKESIKEKEVHKSKEKK
jgi:hypothetical protein